MRATLDLLGLHISSELENRQSDSMHRCPFHDWKVSSSPSESARGQKFSKNASFRAHMGSSFINQCTHILWCLGIVCIDNFIVARVPARFRTLVVVFIEGVARALKANDQVDHCSKQTKFDFDPRLHTLHKCLYIGIPNIVFVMPRVRNGSVSQNQLIDKEVNQSVGKQASASSLQRRRACRHHCTELTFPVTGRTSFPWVPLTCSGARNGIKEASTKGSVTSMRTCQSSFSWAASTGTQNLDFCHTRVHVHDVDCVRALWWQVSVTYLQFFFFFHP